MSDSGPVSGGEIPAEIMDQASLWLARRDRGLTREDQDRYLQWLRADPRHAEALNRCAATLQRMMKLYEWQPTHTAQPNPDLFAPVRRRRSWRGIAFAAAAAIAVAFVFQHYYRAERAPRAPEKTYLLVNERIALPDGSRAELREECHVLVQYSERERRVRLASGEAHFTVMNDATRPFVVEAAGVKVVAIGTSFSVRWEQREVEVLVTSGTVRIEAPAPGSPPATTESGQEVSAGQRAVVPQPLAATQSGGVAVIEVVTPDEIARSLAWLSPRLQFHETPLAEAVRQFNSLNRHQLLLGDAALAELRIGGTFRPDNVEAFVRLLELTFRIRAEKRGDHETVLRKGS